MDIAQGARHSDAVGSRSDESRAFMSRALENPKGLELVIESKNGASKRISLVGNEFTVGRVNGNDICLHGDKVSKRHARFSIRDGQFFISDLQSTNGTYVNRTRINTSHRLTKGDRVYIGDYAIRVALPASPEGPRPPGTPVPVS